MKYIDEFRNTAHTKALAKRIADIAGDRELTFMEVCGTHTMAISRFGIRSLLPKNLRLISGPGCPVCVTANDYLDHAIALARLPNVTITTFGDMMKVPASTSSLTKCRAEGADIRIVTSTTEALTLAHQNPEREVIFLGVGFEATTPTIAASLMLAYNDKTHQLFRPRCTQAHSSSIGSVARRPAKNSMAFYFPDMSVQSSAVML